MANKSVKLKNKRGDYLYPYTDNIPTGSASVAGKVKVDAAPTSGSANAVSSGGVYSALAGKLGTNDTAAKATADANGNNITTTYATKTELSTVQNSVPADNNLVHQTGNETIYGEKSFMNPVYFASNSTVLKSDTNLEGGELHLQRANNDPLTGDAIIDLNNGSIRFIGANSTGNIFVPLSVNIETNSVSATTLSVSGALYIPGGRIWIA
ncbi:MAG: hypothetical protein IKP62_06225 [Salinivirgaceae bacterium]|nr:hypothetical protein [Salinivirgaceae bacterium]